MSSAGSLVADEHRDGLALVRHRLVLAQTLYAVAALLALVEPVAGIVGLAVVQHFFVVSPRVPFRV